LHERCRLWLFEQATSVGLGHTETGDQYPLGEAEARSGIISLMSTTDHDEVIRRSFERQVLLFSGPDSPFAHRPNGTLSWIEPLEREMIVLDVACGAAHAAEPVAEQVRQVVGIDLTPALLEIGAQRLREQGVSNVLLQEAHAESLPFVDGSFDIVYCRSSLHHFADPGRAVDEMVRVCRFGGRIVLLDLVAPSDAVRDQFDHVHRLIDPSHMRSFLAPELAELLPGGVDQLTSANMISVRLPIDVAITDQSDKARVLELLRAELEGVAPPTGFDPAEEDDKLVVSFATCVVHSVRY
jgi:SAM-dependent methyltransferase